MVSSSGVEDHLTFSIHHVPPNNDTGMVAVFRAGPVGNRCVSWALTATVGREGRGDSLRGILALWRTRGLFRVW